MEYRTNWYHTIVREKRPITEDQFIENYDDIKKDVNFLWNMFAPNKGYKPVPGGSILTAPIEVDLLELMREQNEWARCDKLSAQLQLFLKLRGVEINR
jgi:hypothetical protein